MTYSWSVTGISLGEAQGTECGAKDLNQVNYMQDRCLTSCSLSPVVKVNLLIYCNLFWGM